MSFQAFLFCLLSLHGVSAEVDDLISRCLAKWGTVSEYMPDRLTREAVNGTSTIGPEDFICFNNSAIEVGHQVDGNTLNYTFKMHQRNVIRTQKCNN